MCVRVCVCARAHAHASPSTPSCFRLTELHDENALPHRDLETLQYRSQGEGQDNFILSYPRGQDTPEEGSDFSEFEHLDGEEEGEEDSAYYLDEQQEFVVVDDMTQLVVPDEEDLTAYRHNAPDDWFDDPAYAQIDTLQRDQQARREPGWLSAHHSQLHPPSSTLPLPLPPLLFSPPSLVPLAHSPSAPSGGGTPLCSCAATV